MTGGNVMGGGLFSLLAPETGRSCCFGVSGAYPVFGYGRWWTVLSAGWLHGSALHILFNMMWVRDLGPPTADIYGGARMVIIYTVSSALRVSPELYRRCLLLPASRFCAAPRTRWAPRQRFSACSARWCTMAGAAAAA